MLVSGGCGKSKQRIRHLISQAGWNRCNLVLVWLPSLSNHPDTDNESGLISRLCSAVGFRPEIQPGFHAPGPPPPNPRSRLCDQMLLVATGWMEMYLILSARLLSTHKPGCSSLGRGF